MSWLPGLGGNAEMLATVSDAPIVITGHAYGRRATLDQHATPALLAARSA